MALIFVVVVVSMMAILGGLFLLTLSLSLSWGRFFFFVSQIDYFNNKVICDLVEMQHTGVIALLDEACFLVGIVTDRVRRR